MRERRRKSVTVSGVRLWLSIHRKAILIGIFVLLFIAVAQMLLPKRPQVPPALEFSPAIISQIKAIQAQISLPKEAPILTFVTTIGPIDILDEKAVSRNHFTFHSWERLFPRVQFIVISDVSESIEFIRKHHPKVMTAFVKKHTIDFHTYRFFFQLAHDLAHPQSFAVGFTNADIAYNESLIDTVKLFGHKDQIIRKEFTFTYCSKPTHLAMVGIRNNHEPDEAFYLKMSKFLSENREQAFQRSWKHAWNASERFGDWSQDYFVVSKDAWKVIGLTQDLYAIGGIAADNIFTYQFIHDSQFLTIDGTPSISALHVNHGEIRNSHQTTASVLNTQIMNYRKQKFAFTSACQFEALSSKESVRVRRRSFWC